MFESITTFSPEIRKLPYPFRGALALSIDAEFFDFEFFEKLMQFMNSTSNTPLGMGLGLEVTSSVFFYSDKPINFSYFESLKISSSESKHAPRIRDYIRASYIDTNHAFGDFDDAPSFSRGHAEKVLNTMDKHRLKLKIFTNHGGTNNIQNIGIDAEYHQGDKQGSAAYHLDLLMKSGLEYVWTDSLSYAKVIQTNVNGVSSKKTVKSWKQRLFQKVVSPPVEISKVDKSFSILVNSPMSDGTNLTGFRRFRSTGRNAPNFSSFKHQIDQIDFNDLYQNYGALVVYQHLGVLFRENGICTQANSKEILRRPHVYLSGFFKLQEEVQKGALWVVGLIRLLNYLRMIEKVSIRETLEGNTEILYPADVGNPEVFFQGLTFYVKSARKISIRYKDRELPFDHNGPDETGEYSVSIRTDRLEDIWN